MGWILSTGHSCVMFLDSKNVVFVEILLWPSFSTKSGGMPGFYRVKFGHNRISTKFTFLESGNITHECPVLGIHHKFRANLSKIQGRSDRGNLLKPFPGFVNMMYRDRLYAQGIWSGTPWSGSIQKSMAFWIAGLERHSNYWSADCKLMWSVTWHSKRLHSRCLSAQIDCRESQLFPLKI